jgi:hypothetical protein
MAKIIQMSQHMADLIAAGEVVERPSSVVKELCENAIDAGASAITIEIKNGGMTYIRVTDDGCSIAPEDAETAFLRHATSKLLREEELSAIKTLGFRGEALAAICAVSRVELFTRERGAAEGTFISIDGGKITEITGEAHGFGYRKSAFSGCSGIVLRTVFRLKNGDSECIKARMAELAAKRKSTQPLDMPSAGSVFKRPEGYYTGRLIDECGLRGYGIGGARVSEKHSGFIVNAGGATARDVLRLIEYIKEKVNARFGVTLECEIKMLG